MTPTQGDLAAPATSEAQATEAKAGAPEQTQTLPESVPDTMQPQRAVLVVIMVLMIGFTLYLAQGVVLPLVLAILLNLLLSPLVYRLRRLHLPEPLGAAVVILALLSVVGYAVYALAEPAAGWIEQAPQNMAEIGEKIRSLKQPVEEATKQVERLAEEVAPESQRGLVRIERQSWSEIFVIGTTTLLTQTFIVIVLLYFLLASGNTFMRRLVKAMSSSQGKRQTVSIMHAVQDDVTTYLVTTTIINAGVGTVTWLAMWAIGMPNPALWGVVAGVLNYIPYAGAMATIAILGFVGLLAFDDIGHALLAPGLFFVVNSLEANLITPAMVGHRLTLNPALVFVSLVVWSWMWGIVGALLAVPLLVVLKAFADHLPSWQGISIFLGRREE